jgi:hypothetical protein
MSNQYSTNINVLFIPRVFANITEKRIRSVINDLNLGAIEKIDIKRKTTEKGENFNRVYVHLSSWYTNEQAFSARERLLEGKEIKIIYDEPWFWKVSAYRLMAGNTTSNTSIKSDKTPFLSFDEDPRVPRERYQDPRERERDQYPRDTRDTRNTRERDYPRDARDTRDTRNTRERERYQERQQSRPYFVPRQVQHTQNQVQNQSNRIRREEYVEPEPAHYYTMTPPESIASITSITSITPPEPRTPPYSPPHDMEIPMLDYKNVTCAKRKPLKVANKLDTFLSVLQPQDKNDA